MMWWDGVEELAGGERKGHRGTSEGGDNYVWGKGMLGFVGAVSFTFMTVLFWLPETGGDDGDFVGRGKKVCGEVGKRGGLEGMGVWVGLKMNVGAGAFITCGGGQ